MSFGEMFEQRLQRETAAAAEAALQESLWLKEAREQLDTLGREVAEYLRSKGVSPSPPATFRESGVRGRFPECWRDTRERVPKNYSLFLSSAGVWLGFVRQKKGFMAENQKVEFAPGGIDGEAGSAPTIAWLYGKELRTSQFDDLGRPFNEAVENFVANLIGRS